MKILEEHDLTIDYKPSRLKQAADGLQKATSVPASAWARIVTVAGTADSLIDRLSDHVKPNEGHLTGILIDGLLYEEL